jgi:fructose-1,6-bisphosphatase/inositol monophosphatase family enzyme
MNGDIEFLRSIAEHVEREVTARMAAVGRAGLGRKVPKGEHEARASETALIDHIAEQTILNMVEARRVEGECFNVLSEEKGYMDFGGDRVLVVDPIDGTYNALRGIPFYAVSIAIGHERLADVECGVVKNLVTGETYHAVRGKGAFLNDKKIHTAQFNPKASIFSVYLGTKASPQSYSVASLARRVRGLGAAALELCMVASGDIDLYYMVPTAERISLRVTDIAAGTLILREAGGEVYNDAYEVLDMEFTLTKRCKVIGIGDRKVLKFLEAKL